MLRICHHLKIFCAVIKLVFIDMVHNLAFHKKASNVFLHNKPMLLNVAHVVSGGMLWRTNKNISSKNNFSSFPCMVVWPVSFTCVFTNLNARFYRVMLALKCAFFSFHISPITFIRAKAGLLSIWINKISFSAHRTRALNFRRWFFIFTVPWSSHSNLLGLRYYNSIFNGGQELWRS